MRNLGMFLTDPLDVPFELVGLATYGLAATAWELRRLKPREKQIAVLTATAKVMLARAVDDVLEVFDLLMTGELAARIGVRPGRAAPEARPRRRVRSPVRSPRPSRPSGPAAVNAYTSPAAGEPATGRDDHGRGSSAVNPVFTATGRGVVRMSVVPLVAVVHAEGRLRTPGSPALKSVGRP